MAVPAWNPEDHARAVRVAERQQLIDELARAVGIVPPAEQITEPIAVVPRTEQPVSWLSS